MTIVAPVDPGSESGVTVKVTLALEGLVSRLPKVLGHDLRNESGSVVNFEGLAIFRPGANPLVAVPLGVLEHLKELHWE